MSSSAVQPATDNQPESSGGALKAVLLVLAALAAIVAITWFVSVGRGPRILTRSAAADLISNNFEFGFTKSVFINVGKLPRFTTAGGADYRKLQSVGLLRTSNHNGAWSVDLTPAGEKTLKAAHAEFNSHPETTGTYWSVPIATRELENVTGISTHDNLAEVEFSWHWKFTDFGRQFATSDYSEELSAKRNEATLLSSTAHYSTAILRKWDDGWRLERLDLPK